MHRSRLRAAILTLCSLAVVGCADAPDGPEAAPDPAAFAAPSPPLQEKNRGPLPAICEEAPNKQASRSTEKIYYGTRNPTQVQLDDAQKRAVLAIGFGAPGAVGCSGTLIADRIVLTAKHCTQGQRGDSFYAVFGVDDRDPELAVRSTRKREHPSHDMTLLELEFAPGERIDVRPIPIDDEDLSDGERGAIFEQGGYGQTESGRSNGRFFVAEVFEGFSNGGRMLVVNGEGRHGVCFGDSGGPSMRTNSRGETRVVGDLSGGDSSCVGRDNYARTDVVRPWIEEWTGPTPGAQARPCEDIPAEGRCNADGALETCVGGQLRTEICRGGDICGWAGDRWACTQPEADPCAGLGLFGACEGDLLRYCRGGVLVERPCGQCGERCVLEDAVRGHACVGADEQADADGDGVPDPDDLCSGTGDGDRVWRAGEWRGCAAGQLRDRDRPDEVGPDLDLDGVPDRLDQCLDTRPGARVWRSGEWRGCAGGQQRTGPSRLADADADGVVDGEDLCGGTAAGARVWRSGAWLGCAGGQIRDRDRR